jgi:putative sugar O-methyltransferase
MEQFEFDGRLFSRAFLNYLLGINFLKKHCKTAKINRVLEIGGGYGALGEILLSDPRSKCFYIDIDIPPAGVAASYYLQSIFNREKIGDYTILRKENTLKIDELQERYSAVVLCPWQLPKLTGSIDLFVNYISFQEMEPEVVQHYLEHVQRLSPRYILLRNLREGKQIAKSPSDIGVKQPILGEDYDQFLPGYSLTATNTVPFGFETEDGFHSELRLYCRTG